jgi:hypothetical protein
LAANPPFFEGAAEGAVEGLSAGLQETVRAFQSPLHLLLLAEVLADQNVDRRLDEGGRDQLAIAPALSVIRNRADVVSDVGGKFGGGFGEPFPVGIVAFQGVDIVGQSAEPDQSLAAVAMPKPLLDPIEAVFQIYYQPGRKEWTRTSRSTLR